MRSKAKELSAPNSISRRGFLAASATAGSALALMGCSNNLVEVDDSVDAETLSSEGEWIPCACWHNCGSRCLNKALVVDGVVIRQKTDDTIPDSPETPQTRGCLRGRSQRHQVFSEERLKYPMKRKNWSPDSPNGHLRGIDEWERISWDEATQYVANELKKAAEKYGGSSIMYININCIADSVMAPVLCKLGGYTDTSGTISRGTWYYYSPGFMGLTSGIGNDRFELQNSEWIVLQGTNPAWNVIGRSSYYLTQAKDAGAKFIVIGPEYSASAAALDAEWIPVREGTDTAFLLGVAYSMLEQDDPDTNPVIDWDFLDRCTVGFDAEHMPTDAKTDENFVGYLKGEYDGIQKTPEWASEISGTPVELITWYADILRKDNKVSLHCSGSPARNNGAENFPQIWMTIGAMGGHFGLSGHGTVHEQANYGSFNRGDMLVFNSTMGWDFTVNRAILNNPVDHVIPQQNMWSAVMTGKYHYSGHIDGPELLSEGTEREIDIHVIYHESNNYLNTTEDTPLGIEAHRKVDFVCAHAYWMHASAMYSDIVLPVATQWESAGRIPWMGAGDRETKIISRQICEPLYESKRDYDIALLIAEKLGVDVSDHLGADEKQVFLNQLASCQVMKEDKSYEPLLTITEEDIEEWGREGIPQQGRIPLKEFMEKGIYNVPRSKGDNFGCIAFEAFRADPEGNPLNTASGKFEIYCQTKSDYFDSFNKGWPGYSPVSPLPKYIRVLNGYEDSFSDWENKVKGEYPYQLATLHYLRCVHSNLDHVTQLREAWSSPVYINAEDAAEKGIKTGDTVKIWNAQGTILRPASVTHRIMPGQVQLPHGANMELDPETGIDKAGCDNMLCTTKSSSAHLNAYNTVLVNYEKYDGEEVDPDVLWPQRVVSCINE